MNFLTPEQQLWKDTVDRVMQEEITREYVRECDINRNYPYEAYEKVARMGWLRLLVPEEHGGDGGSIFDYALMCEEQFTPFRARQRLNALPEISEFRWDLVVVIFRKSSISYHAQFSLSSPKANRQILNWALALCKRQP